MSGDTTFDTILYPTASDKRDIKVSRMPLSVPTTVASSLKIDNIEDAGTSGYYYVSHEENPRFRRNFDTFTFDGKLAYIENGGDKIKSAIMKSGTTLKHDGANVIVSKMPVNDITVDWHGANLEINGSNLIATNDPGVASAVAIRAFGAKKVKLNGKPISNFTTSDGYIYAVGVPSSSASSSYENSIDLGAGNSGVQAIKFDLIPTAEKVGV